jgi:hypothetical protein
MFLENIVNQPVLRLLLISLSFQPYQVRRNRSSDASWASILVQIGPGTRDGVDLLPVVVPLLLLLNT